MQSIPSEALFGANNPHHLIKERLAFAGWHQIVSKEIDKKIQCEKYIHEHILKHFSLNGCLIYYDENVKGRRMLRIYLKTETN